MQAAKDLVVVGIASVCYWLLRAYKRMLYFILSLVLAFVCLLSVFFVPGMRELRNKLLRELFAYHEGLKSYPI